MTVEYNKINKPIYENEHYLVDVGPYPEETLDCYRVHNKKHGVIEYAHCVQFYATQWADMASDILNGKSPTSPMGDMGLEDLPVPH